MDMAIEQAHVVELEHLTKKLRWYRWGIILVTAIIMTACLWRLKESFQSITQAGPIQEEYTRALRQNLERDVIPRVRSEVTETITELQPTLTQAMSKLKDQLPELSQTAEEQMKALQVELPARGEKVLNRSFSVILTQRNGMIRKMYPNVTEDQLNLLVLNLGEEGRQQLIQANQELFSPHQAKLNSILKHMNTIRQQEERNVKGITPDWTMAVLLLDILREDLKTQQKGGAPTQPEITASLSPIPSS
jgi:cell division protein ZapA (FtsZ GTPase activity inhibitor)